MDTSKPHVTVIGAGFSGCAIAHDLCLRGFTTTVVERGDIANGTSGRTHGLLHSGGRYCVTDPEAGIECIEENVILKKIASQCIEPNDGLFVALSDGDLEYAPAFIEGAEKCGISAKKLTVSEALTLEPRLNSKILDAYLVPDGTFDPLRLAMAFAATAKLNGAKFYTYTDVIDLINDGKGNVIGVKVWNRHQDKRFDLYADMVINATGAWAGQITKMVNASVSVVPTPGIMVAYDQRLVQRVINRLCEPDDGDILIPQRRMVVIGTTSFEADDVDYIPVYPDQIALMFEKACELVPDISKTKMRGAYMSSRPLLGSTTAGRSLSRTFKCFDHKDTDNIDGLVTLTGGKATTCRVMAEKTVDVVCSKLGIHIPCTTKDVVLTSYRNYYIH